ncbi:MAG: putative methyltransferase [Caulobacteraceae bacterium]|nr:putative methyltransferase [Caulobacteraceae bacterium]
MSAPPPLPPNLRHDAFAGLADDYVRYRLPYPAPMVEAILIEARIPPAGARAIDLACGTGRVALAIAPRFANVRAVDLEPEMVEAGRREARRLRVSNILWSVGSAEDFEAPAGAFHLVTAGDSFHRLDRPRVAARALGWLAPAGALVTLGSEGFLDGDAPWRRVLAVVVRAFVGEPARRLGAPNAPIAEEIADQEAVLRAAGFAPVVSRDFEIAHEWPLPELLGNLRSTSVLSRAALGERHEAFEAALTAALLAHDPSGRYAETVRFGYTVAHKPAAARRSAIRAW